MEKKWVRIVVSILGGSLVSESISAYTKEEVQLNSIVIAIVLYFILTAINNSINGSKRKVKVKKEDTDIIDDI